MQSGGRERRIHRRINRDELDVPATFRIPNRPAISLIDLSVGGALIDLPFQLRTDSSVKVEVLAGAEQLVIPFRPLRCHVTSLIGGVRYQAAGAFEDEIRLKAIAVENPLDAAKRLASALETFLRQGGLVTADGRIPEIDHLLAWILDAIRRGEPAERISVEIRSRLSRLIPSLAMQRATGAFLPDPSRSARFFGVDFSARQILTARDRRVLRAAAQFLAIVDKGSQSIHAPREHSSSMLANDAIVHSIADWQTMQAR